MKEYSKDKKPLVSIIVVTYNSARYVIETLESAKVQTYDNIELIVTDDCSTDNTVTICKDWLADHHERFVQTSLITSDKNTGPAPNCNRGMNAANGEWIKCIAGDDMLLENCIQSNIEFTQINQNAKVVHSNSNFYCNDFNIGSFMKKSNSSGNGINNHTSFSPSLKDEKKSNLLFNLKGDYIENGLANIFTNNKIEANEQYQILLRWNVVSAPTVFLHKSIYNDFGHFDESIPFIEDLPMWLRITKAGIKIYFLNSTTVNYRIHNNSITGEGNGSTIFNNYYLKLRFVYVRYIFPEISSWEKYFKNFEYYRLSLLAKLGLNKSNQFNRIIYSVTYLPSLIFEKWVLTNLINRIDSQLKIRRDTLEN